MTDARKNTIIQLIKIRREVEDCIKALCTNEELKQFAQRHEHGLAVRVREVRYYDLEPEAADDIIERFGVPDRPDLPDRTAS